MSVPRRVVTGHDAAGRGVVISDGPAAVSRLVADGASFYELWATASSPAPIEAVEPEPVAEFDPVGPPAGGTRVRVVDMPPGTRSPMHRTESVDYGIVLAGTLTLVLDGDETTVGPGDLVVQRGTDHAWENRGDDPARMLFVLLDGRFGDALLQTLAPDVRSGLMHDLP
ncbi:MAG TPA: cupin domain-containing protein [Solirubrobacteraceae bacterium]|jgi:quercetin dioxygenase-like cupin family protein|nr:cupin domain-containing protein [Solirubrobacteraceae bacterium]